jgi:menaquinone-specific isochorismate synthase
VTTIGPVGEAPVDPASLCTPAGPPAGLRRPARVTVAPVRSADWWCELVARATKAMREAAPEGLRKVVLARELTVEADEPFDRAALLARLRAAYPGCFLFHVDGFLGASPELLVGRSGDVVRAQPMAGTAPRGGDPTTDARLGAALLASPTYRHEHQITIDMVHDTLLPWCSYLDYEAEPSVVGVANVQHLATLVEGRLSQPAPSVLDLVAALHPTPAVSGWPRDLANEWIAEHEGFDRGRYAGTVGWVDGRGNGTWAVSIRCADVSGSTARLCAGNGIVADSDPATELAETQAKLQAVLSALSRV